MADISLLFDVATGSNPAGNSQQLIQTQLQEIVNHINANPLSIKFKADEQSLQSMRNQIKNIATEVSAGTANAIKMPEVKIASKTNKASSEYTNATKAVKAYYDAVQKLHRSGLSQTVGFDDKTRVWSDNSGKYTKEVNYLNQVTQAYDNAKIASQQFNAIDKQNFNAVDAQLQYKLSATMASTANISGVLTSYTSSITRGEEALRKWSAAEHSKNEESRLAYKDLRNNVQLAQNAKEAYQNGSIGIKEYGDQIDKLKTSLKNTENTLKQNGDATKSLSERLSGLAKKFAQWFSVSQIIMWIYRSLKKMVDAVVELDTAMTELKKVTNETDETYEKFLNNATSRAKKLGASLSDVVTASADFARLGFNIEEAEDLADAAIVYKNVGDGIKDVSDASESIIATMQAFGVEAKDVMTIVDKFNEVGNNYAISSKGVGDALLRSAAAMHSANNTLDETIALATASNTIVQDPDKVGTTLKTVSMYLRAAKTEAEDAGESTEGMANSVSELRDEILGLTGNKVDIQIDEDTFKSTYQILKELSEVWSSLSDVSQANILEMVGGKRNANVVSAILENFSVAEKALATSSSASGSALAENEKYLDSINGKVSQFKASFEELSQNVFESESIKGVVELGTTLLEVLNIVTELINKVGGLKTILASVAGIVLVSKADGIWDYFTKPEKHAGLLNFIKGFSKLPQVTSILVEKSIDLGKTVPFVQKLSDAFKAVGVSASVAQLKMVGILAAILAVVAVVKIIDHFTVSLEESREKLAELNQESQRIESELSSLNDELETTAQRIAELEGKDALTFTEEAELKNLKKQNAELKRKIELLAIEAEYKDKQKRETFVETMDKDIKSGVEHDGVYINSSGAPVVKTQTREQYISDQFDKYLKNQQGIKDWENLIAKNYDNEDLRKSYTKEKEKLEKENEDIKKYLNERKDIYAKYVADTSGERIENPQNSEDEQYNAYLDKIDEFNYTYHLIFGGETAPQTVFESLVRSGSIAEASEELVKLGEAGQVTAETLAKAEFQPIIDKIKELGIVAERDGADKIRYLGNQYNSIVNGNVDYNKRPIIPANEMQKYYPEFPNDGVGTTYSQTMTIGEGEALYTINVTPILEDGTVLTQDELNNYVSKLVTGGTTEELLASDTKKLIIHAIDGDYDESEWKQIEEQLGAIKEQHINLVNQFNKNNPDTTWTEYSKGAGILEEIALLFNLLGESAGDAADDIDDSTSAMSDFTKTMSGVQGLQKGLDQLDKIYADIKDGKNFDYSSVLNNKDFTEAFGDLGKSYDDFMKTILNNPSNINACREAFNKLISTYILSSEALNGLTEETKSSTIAFLKQQGVSNAEAIVNERLAISREKARISSELHTNATSAEIVKLQEESEQSQVTLQALAELALAKLDINKSAIDLTSDINQIIALAEKAGATTTSLKELARAKVLLSEAEQLEWAASVYTDENGNPFRDSKTGRPIDLYTDAKNAATQAYKEAQDIINTPIEYTPPEYIGGPTSNSGKNDPKKYDWIETSINRVEQAIQRVQRTADSAYKSTQNRLAATNEQIKLTTKEIALQEKALKKYKKEADSVKLSEDIKAKVRDGSISIDKYDDKTQTLINDYKEWYDKSLACSDAIDELNESLSSLYEKEFDDITTDFDNQLSQLEHLANTYENGLADLEARGYLGGYEYYDALKQNKQQEIALLEQKLKDLTVAFDTAIAKGDIEKGSDSWYSMQDAINGVKEELQSCNTEIIDIDNSVRDLDWETFDFAQERIKALTNEAEFLIELMDESDFFNDKGNITSKGLAAAGLHAVSYNTYMKQADGYAQEILKINKELADDPSNTKLIERREELLELQRESILSAESEKDAISDMVEEGINKQLDAMKELIDTYKESLQSAKDLYEYQKKIKDHTSNIATLQKQLSAYENDTSEETRAKIQKIRVDLEKAQEELEETEYDKYISDTERMLDDFYEDYEETLNARMDNIDALITTMIDTINLNAFDISNTIRSACSDVGYTITDEMRAIWSSPSGVVSEYGSSSFGNSSTSNTVDNIVSKVMGLFTKSSELANNVLNPSVPSNPTETQKPSSGGNSSKNDTANGNKGSNKEIVTGGKINAGNAKIYPSPSGKGATGQYFSGDPIYIVLGEENGYLKVRHHKSKSGVSGWFKKSDVKAYKTGGLVDYTGIAWVDGSPSKPETVLDAEDTQNLVELKEAMKRLRGKNGLLGSELFNSENDMIKGLSESLSKTLNASDFAKQSIDFGGISITIPIDHVSDYNDFVSKLQEDGQFEDFIQDITLGKLTNGSSFSKYKYKW